MKRKKMLWLLLIPIVLSIAIIPSISAVPTYLYVYPEWTSCDVGDTISVNIVVSAVTKRQALWAYQIELNFNPAVLQGVSIANGPFMESKGGNAVFVPGEGFDNEAGYLALCGAYLDPIAKFPFGIDGVILTVTFDVVGEGFSDIFLGAACGLVNSAGRLIPLLAPEHGLVGVGAGPELYIRRRGSHGGGSWPEWHVGAYTEDQTLYARIMNYGEHGAYVEVAFEVCCAGMPCTKYTSNEAWVDAATWVADDIVPGEVVVSVTFPTGTPGVFTVNAKLYFRVHLVTRFYGDWVDIFGGEAVSRDIATKYKVTG